MSLHTKIAEHYPQLDDAQREVISHLDGPMLVIAGPGSGKTHSIILRAINLLLNGKASPKEIVLCTFTQKAAFELRDRLSTMAREVGYGNDLSELQVSTIHSLCNDILSSFRHRSELGHNYDTLDELTQLLFMNEHFDEIIGAAENGRFLSRWNTKWTSIVRARNYFNKITEELVEPQQMLEADDDFIAALGEAYIAYERALLCNNRVDFAHLQKYVLRLLDDPHCQESITHDIKYLLVDEYQDTNFIQEQVLLKLTEQSGNLCVVGDEDQSLYRFRGATVRNILEFPQRVSNCRVVKLTTNYRSHKRIVNAYDQWMNSANWSTNQGMSFRYDKRIEAPDDNGTHLDYPAVVSIWGQDERDEGARFAELVKFLMDNDVITDYNQVALLLHSVRDQHSGSYIEALRARGIDAFCPRARAYFDIPAIRDLVACFAVIFGWHDEHRGNVGGAVSQLAEYVDDAIIQLGRRFPWPHPLASQLREWTSEIEQLKQGETLDLRPADYLYHLLAIEPFKTAVKNENNARNIAIFSQLLNVFQNYYHHTVITHRNRNIIRLELFNSFLRLLYAGGINEYEDPDRPFPSGYVQIMTIHQAKGLEFPVVIVGSLNKQISSPKKIDRDLGQFYHRAPFEPESRITLFDRMRLHYVAFSRPERLLVLTSSESPKDHFSPIWQGLPQWPYVERELLAAQRFELRERIPVKQTYSFTGDLKIYETCPRQYQFFRDYDFTPSRSASIFFGLLVHQTIEEIHRIAIDGMLGTLGRESIRDLFEQTYQFLALSDVRPIGETAKESAFTHVLNYFNQNQEDMKRVVQTEVDVSLEKGDYILSGKVDLLLGGDGKLELLDFKTSPRPKESPELILAYERQLCTYAHILEHRHHRRVDRLMLYWTSEPRKDDALMVLPYDPERVEEAGRHFDETVRQIQARNYEINTPPEASICKECDLRRLCNTEGIITTVE